MTPRFPERWACAEFLCSSRRCIQGRDRLCKWHFHTKLTFKLRDGEFCRWVWSTDNILSTQCLNPVKLDIQNNNQKKKIFFFCLNGTVYWIFRQNPPQKLPMCFLLSIICFIAHRRILSSYLRRKKAPKFYFGEAQTAKIYFQYAIWCIFIWPESKRHCSCVSLQVLRVRTVCQVQETCLWACPAWTVHTSRPRSPAQDRHR